MSEAVELHSRESPFQPTLQPITKELGHLAQAFGVHSVVEGFVVDAFIEQFGHAADAVLH